MGDEILDSVEAIFNLLHLVNDSIRDPDTATAYLDRAEACARALLLQLEDLPLA
jgi:hypothetical protein